MAKKVNYTDKDTGANFPNAYFRISNIRINRPNCQILTITYEGFVDEASARSNKKPIHTFGSVLKNLVITNATDIRSLVYAQDNHTMFENAIDV